MLRPYRSLRRSLGYMDQEQIKQIRTAYRLAAKAHRGQRRQSGESYISHPVAVAIILADFRMDHESVMAALLHDVLEDTDVEKVQIVELFGQSVADLVDGVTKLARINFKDRAEAHAESFRKMVLAMSHDIRVILIKLADRLHNLQTIAICSYEKRARIAKETLAIFAPIAYRLGMHELSQQLKDLALLAWHPQRYRVLQTAVKKARGNRKEMLSVIMKSLKEGLSMSPVTGFEIIGREKHISGIYRKMCEKKLSFSEIMDVYGFRILVDSIDDCYRMLGVVHKLYKPRLDRFKDYIAIPKVNGYQSLHTGLFGPHGVPIEIQIRTYKMEELASSGIAAHWLYKTGEKVQDLAQVRIQQWLKALLEMQQRTGSSLEFIEHVKVDLFPDEVYVFTPKGRIMELPHGATVIDFAYTVHTDIGNHCMAAKIDRRLVPLSTTLKNGQTIEILISKRAMPNPMWLSFAITGKAKGSIRHALRNLQSKESMEVGSRLLRKALLDYGVTLGGISHGVLNHIYQENQVSSLDELCVSIGLGHRNATILANRISMALNQNRDEHSTMASPGLVDHLVIQGTEGSVLVFAECCSPVPGDLIVGLVKPGRGIEIHRRECDFKVHLKHQRKQLMLVQWSDEVKREFTAKIDIEIKDQPGALAQLTAVIATVKASIIDIVMRRKDQRYVGFLLTLSIRNKAQLDAIAEALKKNKAVVHVHRHIK